MKSNLVKVLAAVMLAGGMTVSVNADYTADGQNLNDDNATENSSDAGQKSNGFNDEEVSKTEIPVKLTTGGDGDLIHVYGISYDMTELSYSYGGSASVVWNPVTMTYEYDDSQKDGNWTNSEQTITVTNYSDLPVYVEAEDNIDTEATGVDLSYTYSPESAGTGKLALASAYNGSDHTVGESNASEKTGTITVAMSGIPTGEHTADEIGNVTLTVTGNPTDFPEE